jgi:hypothetical protein
MTTFGILTALLLSSVIVFAISRNGRVKTGLRLGWLTFFFETDRNEPERKSGIVTATETKKIKRATPE